MQQTLCSVHHTSGIVDGVSVNECNVDAFNDLEQLEVCCGSTGSERKAGKIVFQMLVFLSVSSL